MQLTTSSGPISLRAMISRMSSSVAARMAGDFVDVDGGGAAQGEEAHRGAIMPVMRRAAVVAPRLPGRLRRGRQAQPPLPRRRRAQLTVTSPDFPANGAIPARFSCDGDKARPALRFAGVPAGAAELALVVVDPDAGGFVHWTAYALAPDTRALAATGLPAGAREGENSTGATGWTPPCPPSGTHRYEFRLYWLKRESGLGAGAKPDDVIAAVRGERGRQRPARRAATSAAEARARRRAGAGPRRR